MSTTIKQALERAQAAFYEYQMDVDADPPDKHREMMSLIDAALAELSAPKVEGRTYTKQEVEALLLELTNGRDRFSARQTAILAQHDLLQTKPHV